MARRRKKSAPGGARLLLLVLGIAVLIFLAGEGVRYVRSDSGAFAIARTFDWGDRPRLTQIVGRQVRRGLATANVPRDSVREMAGAARDAPVRWRVGVAPEQSLIQTNFAITSALRQTGGRVFAARERTAKGATEVALTVGVGRRRTHEIVLARGGRPEEPSAEHPARVALVLYGFGDDNAELARRLFALRVPFAVAVPPDGRSSVSLYREAHRNDREVVLHLPLEPINYPQVSPGPGTLLVTMNRKKIASEVRKDLSLARPVVAVANLMGSLATQDMTVMTAIYEELRRERLPFVHLNPAPGAVCRPLASQLGIAYEEPDAVIDHEARQDKPAALAKAWKNALADARPGSERIVWLRGTETSAEWVAKSLDPAKLKDVSLVPLSALLRRPPQR
jgi:polysaccharide deacetylase 2 family uncharacterized protein YibQ